MAEGVEKELERLRSIDAKDYALIAREEGDGDAGRQTNAVDRFVEEARLACRDKLSRMKLRKKPEVFEQLRRTLELENLPTSVGIMAISAFGNLVVDDDVEFSACIGSCTSGLLDAVIQRCELALGNGEDGEESKLQFVSAIALGNFAAQLVDQAEDEEENGEEDDDPTEAEQLLRLVAKSRLVGLCFEYICNGAKPGVKRSGMTLLSRLASIGRFRESIIASDELDHVLLALCECAYSDEPSMQQAAIDTVHSVWLENQVPVESDLQRLVSSGTICIFGTLMRGNAKREGQEITFSDKIRLSAGELLLGLTKQQEAFGPHTFERTADGTMKATPKAESEEEQAKREALEAKYQADKVARSKLINSCGVGKMALQAISNRISSEEAIDRNTREENCPEPSVIKCAELLLSLVYPVELQGDTIDEFIESKYHQVLIRTAFVESYAIDQMVEAAKQKRKQTSRLDLDVDRKALLPRAQLRKLCLLLLSTMACSKERCAKMIPPAKDVDPNSPFNKHFDGQESIGLLCIHTMLSMSTFDFEGTNMAVNLLRNLCLDPENRKLFLEHAPRDKLGPCLIQLVSNQDHNTAGVAASILRLFCALRDPDILVDVLPPPTMRQALGLDPAKLHPFVRVELARALSYAVQTVATYEEELAKRTNGAPSTNKGKGKAKAKPKKDRHPLAKTLLTVEVVALVGFLLQSDHEILLGEAFESLASLPASLGAMAKSEHVYMPKEEAEEEGEQAEEDLVDSIEKAVSEAMESLYIESEDLDRDMANSDETIRKHHSEVGKMEKERRDKKGKSNSEKDDEPELVPVELHVRVSQILEAKETPQQIKDLAKIVLDKMNTPSSMSGSN